MILLATVVILAIAGLVAITGTEGDTDSQSVDLLNMVSLEALLTSFEHDLETFDYGGPIEHFPGGPSISISERGEIEQIGLQSDGWSCRAFRYFFARARAQACPDDLSEEQAESMAHAETRFVEVYRNFIKGAGVSSGRRGMERRFEMRANEIISGSRVSPRCGGLTDAMEVFDSFGEFTTTEGVAELLDYHHQPPIFLAPVSFEQCFREAWQ